jgi:hypothetical protein
MPLYKSFTNLDPNEVIPPKLTYEQAIYRLELQLAFWIREYIKVGIFPGENVSYAFSKKLFISSSRDRLISSIHQCYDYTTSLEIINKAH